MGSFSDSSLPPLHTLESSCDGSRKGVPACPAVPDFGLSPLGASDSETWGEGVPLVLKPIQREAHLAGKLLLYNLVHKCIVQIPDFLACVC